jgi:flagellar biogenesis protein FliO
MTHTKRKVLPTHIRLAKKYLVLGMRKQKIDHLSYFDDLNNFGMCIFKMLSHVPYIQEIVRVHHFPYIMDWLEILC